MSNIQTIAIVVDIGHSSIMKCPMCEGSLEPIRLESISGANTKALQCVNCAGIWVDRLPTGGFATKSVHQFDTPAPNYSLKNYNLICPYDQSLMSSSEYDSIPTGCKYFHCLECSGVYYPKGQLALFADWQDKIRQTNPYFALSRSRVMAGTVAFAVGVVAMTIAYNRSGITLNANEINSISDAAPNLFTLVMLGLIYMAGTVLAVLGRKRALVYLGWAMIIICLFGISLIVFAP